MLCGSSNRRKSVNCYTKRNFGSTFNCDAKYFPVENCLKYKRSCKATLWWPCTNSCILSNVECWMLTTVTAVRWREQVAVRTHVALLTGNVRFTDTSPCHLFAVLSDRPGDAAVARWKIKQKYRVEASRAFKFTSYIWPTLAVVFLLNVY